MSCDSRNKNSKVGGDSLSHTHMGSSQNYGPLLLIGYITAPNIQCTKKGALILGATPIEPQREPFAEGERPIELRIQVSLASSSHLTAVSEASVTAASNHAPHFPEANNKDFGSVLARACKAVSKVIITMNYCF